MVVEGGEFINITRRKIVYIFQKEKKPMALGSCEL
jgi:hypothetical protein